MFYFAAPVTHDRGTVTVFDYQRGLLYQSGRFAEVLGPGEYWIWPFSRRRITVVDMRRRSVNVANQRLLTADQVSVTISLSLAVEVADAAAFIHASADATALLYEDAQLVARGLVAPRTVDELLAGREAFDAQLLAGLQARTGSYGLLVAQAGLKDVTLPARVRDLLMKETETKRLAAAALLAAREEVATMRALANAARLAAENPHLLALRELVVLRAFAAGAGNTVVLGEGRLGRPGRGHRRADEE
jgi:regulator of protease activity HflC (stomatin/prohibitin superfamily)